MRPVGFVTLGVGFQFRRNHRRPWRYGFMVLFNRGLMFVRSIFSVLFISLVLAPVSNPGAAKNSLWQELAPGIAYREFYLEDPNHVYVARMSRRQTGLAIESGIGQGKLSGGAETVREQAARYDQAINYWGKEWGARNQVIVAINGSYFETQTGIPWSGQVHSGWYAKRFEDRQRSSGFVWTLDQQAFVGECVVNRPGKQLLHLLRSEKSLPFDGINLASIEDGLVIFTPQYDAATPTLTNGKTALEFLVELKQPLTITPTPAMVIGTVKEVLEGEGATLIPFDHIVLSARGKRIGDLKGKLAVGDEIGVSQELSHFKSDCRTPNPASWSNAYASVAGSYIFLAEGVIQAEDDLGAVLRNPRTAIALNDDAVFFIVVDGRDRLRSLGMSMVELAIFAKTRLGADWGIALDGGGSSTMVVNGQIKNNPNAELIESSQPIAPGQPLPPSGPTKIERAVANSLMMVVVQPKELSKAFKSGDSVVIQDGGEVNMRLGPGTNYAIQTTLSPGSRGVVVEHPMNGVLAKGYYWWKINFAGITGWVNQDSLALQP